MNLHKGFSFFAKKASDIVGSPWSFIGSLFLVSTWAISGWIFHFTDTWQLVMNTISSIVTFLIVFLIQNTQNRDTNMTQIKLDELIKAAQKASNKRLDLEDLSDQELQQLLKQYKKLSNK